jgi:hypothetical protein
VNAKEGLDEDAATTIAAPAIVTRTPLAMRRAVIGFLRACPAKFEGSSRRNLNALRLRLVAYFIKRIVKNLTYFISEAVTWPPSVMTGKKVICCPTGH